LGPEDSGLTISNYQGEEVYVSGGIPLTTNWKPYNVTNQPTITVYQNTNNVYGRAANKADTELIKYLGLFDTTAQCQTACLNFSREGQTCKSFTFFLPSLNSSYARQCFAEVDDTWGPTPDDNIDSGRVVQYNVYVADLSGQGPFKSIPGLQQPNGGKRAVRARYPNADTETAVFPAGWVLFTQSYLPSLKYNVSQTLTVQQPQRTDIIQFKQYTIGVGGPCSIFTPPESYWCSSECSGGGAAIFQTPSGLVYNKGTFLNQWSTPEEAVIHVWHPAHWAMWMYKIDSHDPASRTIKWSYGGFQGARGDHVGHGRAGEWYVENILEELDTPNEYYFDTTNQLLYYFYNGTGSPPSNFQLIASNLKTLIDVRGSQDYPVRNIKIQGIKFVNTAYTFLDPHGVPSGGDWAMQRSGALFFEGTESVTVDGCLFKRLDGNALVLSGYNRNATVSNSEFVWIGESAMVAWGYSEGIDGTGGNQPRFTTITGNLVHEIGHFEKQASPWFQAISCQTTLSKNIMFNGPRALINFNDGFGGGNQIINNLLFNPNRETSDQGPFNSWDRQPFLTDVLDGTPQLTPAYNSILYNFMLCNYGSNMCIDNDDGSSYYLSHHNFEVYGGHKSDFGGHNKFTYNSIVAYSQDYKQGLCGNFNDVASGFTDGYYDNICVQGEDVPYITIDPCRVAKPNPAVLPVLRNNSVYNSNANITVNCGGTIISEKEFQKMGFDLGTTAHPLPSDDQIIAWGRALLGF
jgi:hypothetical protein